MPTADWYRHKAEESVSLAKTAIMSRPGLPDVVPRTRAAQRKIAW